MTVRVQYLLEILREDSLDVSEMRGIFEWFCAHHIPPSRCLDGLDLLAQASLPLGLLCVGAALQPNALRLDGPAMIISGAVRLLLMPLLAALTARIFDLNGTEALVLGNRAIDTALMQLDCS
mgnify:FL=1|tara:strand:+ start:7013 stop:7378 length:366 start_codon:yes stop_codon:yes gene_type:complete